MTQQTRSVNKGRFEQGDKPQGADYIDLVDSYLSLADSTAQVVTSNIEAPTLIATTGVTAPKFVGTEVSASAGFFTTIQIATLVTGQRANMSAASFRTTISADGNTFCSTLSVFAFATAVATAVSASGSTGTLRVPTTVARYLAIQVCGRTMMIPCFEL